MIFQRSIIAAVLGGLLLTPFSVLAVSTKTSRKPLPYGAPVELRVPRLGIKAKVEKTSIDRQGQLEAPKNRQHVGWYRHGIAPGERGNAVIGGHVDSYEGPAVFRNLHRLRRGDTVEVKNDFGRVSRFRVTGVGTYVNGELPLQRVVGKSRGFNLNLYTCTGSFDRSVRNYSHRVVAFTKLVK